MKIKKIDDSDCFLISSFVAKDDRGSFIKTFNSDQLTEIGVFKLEECFFSTNKKNVVRGMHYQSSPYTNNKIIFVTEGEIIDVFVDIRKNSKEFGKVYSSKISSINNNVLIISKGYAHGFKVLSDQATVVYMTDKGYQQEFDKGILWSSINFKWPNSNHNIVSARDKNHPTIEDLWNEQFLE